MKAVNLNHLWGKLIIEELTRTGIDRFIIAPGSRSTPLVVAVAENAVAKAVVHYDERGAGYYAVGYAQATAKPAVVICTSGTAVANLLPAIIECSYANLPLLVMTADRPPELHDTGAAQTITQAGIFGEFVRWHCDLPTATDEISPRYVLSTIDQAVAKAVSGPPGPVHINCRFREPLAPVGTPRQFSDYLEPLSLWLSGETPLTRYVPPVSTIAAGSVEVALRRAKSGMIVAGRLPASVDPAPILDLARKWSWPVVADIVSQGRTSGADASPSIAHSDLLFRSDKITEWVKSDFVLQFGATPLSKSLLTWVNRADQYVVIDQGVDRLDPQHCVTLRVAADAQRSAAELREIDGVSPSRLLKPMQAFDGVAAAEIDWLRRRYYDEISELLIADEIFRSVESDRALYLGASMPIRLADAMASQTASRLFVGANRGVNGIDGTIAAAVGFAAGADLPGTLLLGDLALLHDVNSLALLANSPQPIVTVVINNDGGGIFEYLPVAQVEKHFEKFFAAPHGRGFFAAAELFGIKHYHPKTVKDFATTYHHALRAGKPALIEVTSDRKRAVAQFRELIQRVEESALRTLPEIVNSR